MAKRKIARKRKASRKRRSPRRRKSKASAKGFSANWKAQWKAYKDMQKKVNTAWSKLQTHAKQKASPQTILRDRNNLLLLLGECNYLSRECMRCARVRHARR